MDSFTLALNIFYEKLTVYPKLGLGLTLAVVYIAYKYKKWIEFKRYFKNINIPGPEPTPFLGNSMDIINKGLIQHDLDIIKKYGKVVGYFEGSEPVLLVTDVDLLKSILISDFSSFVNRRVIDGFYLEPADKFLTVLKDDEWKTTRSILTVTFTSGKLKKMSKCMTEKAHIFDDYLDDLINNGNGQLDTKKMFGSFTLDVISSCCFGIELNSIKEKESIYLKHVQALLEKPIAENPAIALFALLPSFARILANLGLLHLFPKSSIEFLTDLTGQIVALRKDKTEKREDFIQHIIEHESSNDSDSKIQKNKKIFTNKEILANAIMFLIDGYETTTTTLCFLSYNLVMNQDYQDRMCQEIDEAIAKTEGEITFETASFMPLTEMAIYETLRMYPPSLRIDRVANKDYEYGNIKLKKGQIVGIPIWAVHYDEETYPEPNKFKPERFNEANKSKLEGPSFLAFGAGPRGCIASRFAILEMKLLLASVLRKYKFTKSLQTPDVMELEKGSLTKPVKPIIVGVESR